MANRELVLPTYQSEGLQGLPGKLFPHDPSLRVEPGDELPANTVRATIVDKGQEYKSTGYRLNIDSQTGFDTGQEYTPTFKSLYTESELVFAESDVPREFNLEGRSYPLKASAEVRQTQSLLEYGEGYQEGTHHEFEDRYGNPDSRKLLTQAYSRIRNARLSLLDQGLGDYLNLEGLSKSPNDVSGIGEIGIQELLSDIENEAWEATVKWFESLVENNEDYRVHDIAVNIGGKEINMRRLIIGSIDYNDKTEAWEIDKVCLESLIFMNEELGMDIPEDMLIVTLADTDGNESLYSELRQNDFSSLAKCGGVADRDLGIFICVDTARQRVDVTKKENDLHVSLEIKRVISRARSGEVHRHEITHLVDTASYDVTSLYEGLAAAMENGFYLEEIVAYQRSCQKFATKRTIDEEYLERLMSSINDKQFQEYEIYYTSGALFTFIASKIGYKAFGDFYRLITGQSVAIVVDGNIVATHTLGEGESHPDNSYNTSGDLTSSLRAVLMLQGYNENAEGKTTNQVIDAYMQEFCNMINLEEKRDGK